MECTVNGFTRIDSDELVKEQLLLADRFATVFKAPYKVTTYGDQKRKWNVECRLNARQLYKEDEHHLACGPFIVQASDTASRFQSGLFQLAVSCLSCKQLIL